MFSTASSNGGHIIGECPLPLSFLILWAFVYIPISFFRYDFLRHLSYNFIYNNDFHIWINFSCYTISFFAISGSESYTLDAVEVCVSETKQIGLPVRRR
jgi:hypothetical protein